MKQRIIAMVLVLCSAISLLIPQVMAEEKPVTRMEWVQQLVKSFDIAVDEQDYPDNYYSDISTDTAGYAALMSAVQYGAIDLGAREAFRPEEPATRAFAAQTLNDMLGFCLDSDTVYTYDEAAELEEPDVLQVALDRGWFTLTDGKVLPEQAVTSTEMDSIFTDVAALREQAVVDPNYDSTYTFVDGVIVVPEGTDVTEEEGVIHIGPFGQRIAEGDRFVVWGNGIPMGYVADKVSWLSGVTTIEATRAEDEEIFKSIDDEGVIYVDPTDVIPAEGTTVSYYAPELDRDFNSYAEAQAALRGNGVNSGGVDLKLKGTYELGDAVSINISGVMKNVTFSHRIQNKSVMLRMEYDLEFKYSLKCDLAAGFGADKVPLLFYGVKGIGGLDVSLEIEAALSSEGTQKTHIVNELSYQLGGSLELLGKSTPVDFVHTLEGSAKVGIVGKLGITDFPVVKGYAYIKAGGAGKLKTMTYEDGDAPFECRHFAAYLYANAGVKASIKLLGAIEKSCSFDRTLLDENNSPLRISHHYEDGKLVQECTHGNVDEWFGKWSTRGDSRYMSSGWSSGFGGTGYGAGGVPVIIYDYSVDDNGNATITHYYGSARSLVIPAKLDGYPVVKIGDRAFENNKRLWTVTIPDSVTEIGDYAFSGCTALTSVTLPKNLTTLGYKAFGSSGLTEITIPKTLTTAAGYSGPFDNCKALHTATLEDGMTAVAAYLFAGCNGLQSVTIPDSVTEIGRSAVDYCVALSEVTIPDKVTNIGIYAFRHCEALSSITIPESVTQIDNEAFASCTSLTAIELPNSITSMGTGIFRNCTALKDVTLPNIRQNITASTFQGCTALEKIVLPDTVTSIRDSAFRDCSTLKEIVWSEDLSLIEANAFRGCAALTEVSIPEGVTSLGNNVFCDCDALTSITIPNSVSSLGTYAFYDCDALTTVKLGSGLTKLPDSTFRHCDVLAELRVPRRVTAIGDNVWKDCVKFRWVFIPRSVTSISTTAFSYPDKLTICGVPGTYAETYATENGITFEDGSVPAEAATLSQTELALYKGGSTRLELTVTPENFTDEVIWKCSDTSVATVSDDGTVKAVSGGSATVKVSVGSISLSCRVTVLQPVTSVYISGSSSRTLEALQTCQLTASVSPSDAHDPRVEWSSSDPTVATVDESGLVTAIRKGSVTITAAALDGSGKYDTCQITVRNSAWICDDPTQLESPHNYENNCTDVWQYTAEGASELWVTFDERTYFEDGFDYLIVYDGDGTVTRYTGTALSGATLQLSGDTLKLRLDTDSSGTEWGFKVTELRTDVVEPDPEPEPVAPAAPVVTASNVEASGVIKLSWDVVEGAAQYEVYRSDSENGTYTLAYTTSGTSYTNSGLTPGVTYYYKVRAISANALASDFSSALGCVADCARPQVKTGNVTSTGRNRISWESVKGAERYEVYRSSSRNGTYTLKATVTDTTWTDSASTAGYTYYYKVKALCGRSSEGDSALSSAVSRTADCAAPKASSSNVSTGGIKLTWNSVSGASKYEIWRATDNKNYSKYDTTSNTTYTNKSVTPGKTYYYMIIAICDRSGYGNSAYSNVASRTADCVAPKISSSNVSTGGIKLTWNTVNGASKYYIYRSTDGGETYKYYDSTTKTSWTNKSVTPGKSYYYKVKAVCSRSEYGNSAYSNVANRTADCAAPKLSIQLSSGKPQLKWSAVDGASKYYIYRSTDGKNFSFFDSTTKTSYTNTGAKSGTTYYYKLVAVCAKSTYGNSAYSNTVSIKSK